VSALLSRVAVLGVVVICFAASQSADAAVAPANGSGAAYASGTTSGTESQYTATLNTGFSPAHIQPGDPFTYTANLQADHPSWDTRPPCEGEPDLSCCTPGPVAQTGDYGGWDFLGVEPGKTIFDDGWDGSNAAPSFGVSVSYSNTETITDSCPAMHFDDGLMTVSVPGAQTKDIAPGCYQSTIWESGIYFPTPNGASGAMIDSLSGSLGTLAVGKVRSCARKKTPTLTCRTQPKVAACSITARCPTIQPCETVSGPGDMAGVKGRAVFSERSRTSHPLAEAEINLLPNELARITMPLTQRGRKVFAKLLRDGENGPFTGWIEFNGDRSAREPVKVELK
jgi:hypothetical protein